MSKYFGKSYISDDEITKQIWTAEFQAVVRLIVP